MYQEMDYTNANWTPYSGPMSSAPMAQAMANSYINPNTQTEIMNNGGAVMQGGGNYNSGSLMGYSNQQQQQQQQGYGNQQQFDKNGAPAISGWQKFSHVMQGIGTLANIIGGIKSYKLAKKQFEFQKQSYATDLYNSATDYNMKMEGRHQASGTLSNRDAAATADKIDRNKMKTAI